MEKKKVLEFEDIINRPLFIKKCVGPDGFSDCDKCALVNVCHGECSIPSKYIFILVSDDVC